MEIYKIKIENPIKSQRIYFISTNKHEIID